MEKIEKLTDNHENENTKQRKLNLKTTGNGRKNPHITTLKMDLRY